ncbi:MAG TPA: DegT/DnrJ/EryC1/StrS family aminotransferase [Gemmatimonadaceae bacterium]|nr:DegT/DnrJ/EryC1/StrS family aminotransferase [Gemmatimonadaceae bacterium]
MIGRRQLPVSSTITASSLVRALAPTVIGGSRARAALDADLRRAFGASSVALVDSGTSALAMAMRATTRAGGVVALPAYACVDVGAAAIFAQLRVRLYDMDPATLSPDLESVSRVLAQGVDTIVVAHLYGYAADVPGIAALAAAHGVAVIEDAAQGAWGTLLGKRLGSFGPLTVLSFGRGKGMTGGGGGALLGIGANVPGALVTANEHLASPGSSLRTLAIASAQWALGRPSLYSLPSAIPALHLGETIYHPAHDPRRIAAASASLARASLARAGADLALRGRHADALARAAERATGLRVVRPISGAEPGYLRFPVLLTDARTERRERAQLGIVRGYPDTLAELAELKTSLLGDEKLLGARDLQHNLVTLPTHSLLSENDLRQLTTWIVD